MADINELADEGFDTPKDANGESKLVRYLQSLAAILALYDLIIASRLPTLFGLFVPPTLHRAINLMVIVILAFAWFSVKGKRRAGQVKWYDLVFIGMGVVGAGYAAVFYNNVLDYTFYGYLDTKGVILVALIALPLFELVRRVAGWVLPSIIASALFITVFQNYLPGILFGKGYDLDRLGYALYAGGTGIFGLPLGVATSILIVYIVFARLLQVAGGGQWFIDIALSVTGGFQGGPAKAAVAASGFFGTISGSPTGNVATTGAFTIPLMKKIGYPAHFSGAVEAVASTGGQFMPPVMGAIAFVMAEWLALPYSQIAIAAFMPAIIYYIVLFMSIHFESKRLNLPAIPRSELPSLRKTLVQGWFYVVPIVVLIYLLIFRDFAPEMAAIFSIMAVIGVSFLSKDKDNRLTPGKIWEGLASGVRSWIIIGVVTAAIGMLIGALELSGLSIRFTQFILDLSGGLLVPTLLLVAVASFILGMGLDSLPCYITLGTIAAPALIKLGIPMMDAHFFVMYFGLASFITPPVCLAVYVACGISGSKIWETGLEAVRLGIAVFIVPFAFVFNRALLFQGTAFQIVISSVTALIGATLLAAAMRGYLNKGLVIYQRILLFISGLLLISPGWKPALAAFTITALSLIPIKSFANLKSLGAEEKKL